MGLILYRNNPGILNKIQAQFGYALVLVVSLVESAIASALTLLSLFTLFFSKEPIKACATWLKSSSFTIGWSLVNFFINPFYHQLIADEQSAATYISIEYNYYPSNVGKFPSGSVI